MACTGGDMACTGGVAEDGKAGGGSYGVEVAITVFSGGSKIVRCGS